MMEPLPRTGPSSRCRLQLMTKMRLSSFSRDARVSAPSVSGSSVSPVGPLAIANWIPVNTEDLLLFAGAALCSSFGIGLGSLAYRSASASDLAPFGYSGLIWSLGVTWIVWGTIPGSWTFVGAFVIASSSLFHFITSRGSKKAT